jgi:single-stranded-DNA-specific exonuclease
LIALIAFLLYNIYVSNISRGICAMKRWIIKNKITDGITVHSNKLINNLLLSRGIRESSEVHKFLKADLEGLHNPFLLKDMDRAVERIDDAIRKREKIVIYGDYDVDGITSTSILYRAFKKLGIDVSYYIPDRMSEGYGINKEAIEYIKSLATDLIITVDCGISAIEEVEYAKSLGIDIIITDHHECKENIPDTIVINPKRRDCSYPFKSLAGCGVAFKLVQALWMKYNLSGFEELLDIAAIGTIADIVDLRGENRIITKNGLKKIITSEKCGIRALKTISGIGDNVSSYSVAFQIAPRINAIGRLRDAKIAVELFTTNDYDKAMQIAKYLDQENKNRQKIEEEILNEALIKIENEVNMKEDRVIVLSSPNWHIGVVGIVASRIVERFNRPVILICEEGEKGRGSGRSIEGFNLFDNLCECKDILLKFGGHELAAGLSIEVSKISELRQRLNELAKKVDSECFLSKLNIDMEVNPEDVSLETAETLKMFEPFGCGNPAPLFYMEQLSVLMKRGIGNKEQHLKLLLEKDGYRYDGISFNGSKDYLDKDWDYVDVAFNMDVNEWNNNKNVQLKLD